jgi:hypothetical protein
MYLPLTVEVNSDVSVLMVDDVSVVVVVALKIN